MDIALTFSLPVAEVGTFSPPLAMQGSGHLVAALHQGKTGHCCTKVHARSTATCTDSRHRFEGGASALHKPRASARYRTCEGWAAPMPSGKPALPVPSAHARAIERDAVRPSRAPRIADPEEGVDWRRLSGVLLRFKWLIAGVTLTSTAGGVVASRFVKPQYAAQATVWIDESDRRSYGTPDRGPLRPGQTFEAEAWVALLRSYSVLDSVARDLRLYLTFRTPEDSIVAQGFSLNEPFRPGSYEVRVDPPSASYVLSAADGTELERGTLGDSIGTRLGFRWAPGAAVWASHRRVQFTVSSPRDGARWLAEALDAHIDEDGNFLTLQLEGPNPQRLAAIVNAPAARYVAVAADLQRLKLTERTKILGQQVTYAQQSLQKAAPLSAAVKEWTAKEADLRALRYRYSDAHPRVAKLAGEIATLEKTTIPELARELIARLDARARGLD